MLKTPNYCDYLQHQFLARILYIYIYRRGSNSQNQLDFTAFLYLLYSTQDKHIDSFLSRLLSWPSLSFSLPVVSQIQGHIVSSSPPSPLRYVACIFIAIIIQHFLHCIASNRFLFCPSPQDYLDNGQSGKKNEKKKSREAARLMKKVPIWCSQRRPPFLLHAIHLALQTGIAILVGNSSVEGGARSVRNSWIYPYSTQD